MAGFLTIAGLLLLGFFLMALLVGRRAFEMKDLAHKGLAVRGRVTGKFRQRGASANMPSSPCLRYEYQGLDGNRYEYKSLVTESEWEAHEEGGPIEIVILPGKPSVSAPKYLVNLSREALKLPPL